MFMHCDPVRRIATDPDGMRPRSGTALGLSGGGYRAMLFHAGALRGLHEAGLLTGLNRISSLSVGSITATSSVCDAAIRKHADTNIHRPNGFPYPGSGV